MRYSDMMGLEMYDDGLGAWMDGETLQRQMMASLGGAGGILLTSAVLSRIPAMVEDPAMNSRLKNVLAIAVGVVGGRMLYDQNRDAAMGFVGGVAGLGLAQLVASWAPDYLSTSLSGGLSGADLAALEAAVATNSPSWSAGALSAPIVREQALAGTVASTEDIAGYGYAPAPSF